MKLVYFFFIILISCNIDKSLDKPVESKSVSCKYNIYFIENLCEDEKEYLEWAKKQTQFKSSSELTREVLHNITQETLDVDKSAALFYYRTIEEERNKKFLNYLDKKQKELMKILPDYSKKNILVAVVPGMFYKDNPNVGADGKSFRKLVVELGLKEILVEVEQLGLPEVNGQFICKFLENENKSNGIILATVSKGASDFKFAIKQCGDKPYFKKVKGWYNIGGINRGTLVIDGVLDYWKYRWESRIYFWWKGYNYDAFVAMRREKNAPLDFDIEIPKHILVINVVGIPNYRYVTNRAKPYYEYLIRFGPNDGMTLLSDSYIENSLTYPSWRNDHYFQWAIYKERVQSIMAYMIESQFK